MGDLQQRQQRPKGNSVHGWSIQPRRAGSIVGRLQQLTSFGLRPVMVACLMAYGGKGSPRTVCRWSDSTAADRCEILCRTLYTNVYTNDCVPWNQGCGRWQANSLLQKNNGRAKLPDISGENSCFAVASSSVNSLVYAVTVCTVRVQHFTIGFIVSANINRPIIMGLIPHSLLTLVERLEDTAFGRSANFMLTAITQTAFCAVRTVGEILHHSAQ